jgi:hypothetical protein
VYNIGEICLKYPRNSTQGVCNEFKTLYPNHKAGLFVYGDPAGRHEDTRLERGHNDFTIIENELKDYRPVLRLSSAAPSVVMRGKWINSLFAFQREPKVYISEKSPNLIADLMNGKEAADGTKFKQKVKDTVTGITYEKYHHCDDSMDYLLCQIFLSDYTKFLSGDSAYKPVISQRFTRSDNY